MPDIVVIKFKQKDQQYAAIVGMVVQVTKEVLRAAGEASGRKVMVDAVKQDDGYVLNIEFDGAAKFFGLDNQEPTPEMVESAWKQFNDLKDQLKDMCEIEYSVVSTESLGLQA